MLFTGVPRRRQAFTFTVYSCALHSFFIRSFPSLGFCGLVSGNYYGDVYHSAITSLSGNLSRPYVCEMELPSTSPSPTPTRTATSSSTPSYLSSLTISPTSTPTLSLTPSVSISASPTPSPTVTQSMICASGWTHYEDVDGTEGRDSCLRLTAVNYTYWVDASVNCPVGSHLLTVSSSSIAGGLPQLVFAIVSGAASWLGCSQSSSATWMNGGWSWVDGTPNGNLNCGAPNAMYCGVWATAEPK